MKKMKRALAAITAVLVLASMMPLQAFAAVVPDAQTEETPETVEKKNTLPVWHRSRPGY